PDGQRLWSAVACVSVPPQLAVGIETKVRAQAAKEDLERDRGLLFGEPSPQAAVRPVAEAQDTVRIASSVKAVGIGKVARVSVRRRDRELDDFTGADQLVANGDVLERDPRDRRNRGLETQRLLDDAR